MAERNPRELESRAQESRGADNRAMESRAAELRAKIERYSSQESSGLPQVNPEEGYTMRWIRLSTLGTDDPVNISHKFQVGWEPVKASEHPEVFVFDSGKGRFADTIQIGGLMLCKTPSELVARHESKLRDRADAEMRAVDNNFMRENDPRMPLFKQHKSEISKFGRGT